MSKIHKIGEEYYVEFYARGLLYQQKAGNDLKKAEELLRSIEEKIAKGEVQTIVREIDLDVFFRGFLIYAKIQNHPATVRRLASAIEHFNQYLQSHHPDIQRLSQITPRVIEDYKTFGVKKRQDLNADWNPKIINLALLLLREILEYGIKIGFINDNPTLHVRLLDTPSNNLDLSDEQLSALLTAAEQPYRNIFILMRYTGLRANEALDLTWQQVDFNRNVIFVKLREIPLMHHALVILKEHFVGVVDHKALVFVGPSGRCINIAQLVFLFDEAQAAAGFPSLSLAALRRAFIKDLFHKRMSILSVGKMMGIHDAAKLMVLSSYIPLHRQDVTF